MLETTHAALSDLSVRLSTLEVDLHATECRVCDAECSESCPVFIVGDAINYLSYRLDDAYRVERSADDA